MAGNIREYVPKYCEVFPGIVGMYPNIAGILRSQTLWLVPKHCGMYPNIARSKPAPSLAYEAHSVIGFAPADYVPRYCERSGVPHTWSYVPKYCGPTEMIYSLTRRLVLQLSPKHTPQSADDGPSKVDIPMLKRECLCGTCGKLSPAWQRRLKTVRRSSVKDQLIPFYHSSTRPNRVAHNQIF